MASCDVVIENFKLGSLKKYGLPYDQIAETFPSIIRCSIPGFGQTGPNAHPPSYDPLAQGFGGLISINTIEQALDGDQAKARDSSIKMVRLETSEGMASLIGNPIRSLRTPVTYLHPPPTCGAYTDDVLISAFGKKAYSGRRVTQTSQITSKHPILSLSKDKK